MKKKLFLVVLVLIVLVGGYVSVHFYSTVFSKHVIGEIVDVERVTQPSTIISGNGALSPTAMFSFAVAIRTSDGEIATASSEDRQWAVAHKGQCAEARFSPYPPWELQKAGTYFDARLLKLSDCPGKSANSTPETAPIPRAS